MSPKAGSSAMGNTTAPPTSRGHDDRGMGGGMIHALIGDDPPQSGQRVVGNTTPHCGQTACVSNVSNALRQAPHNQNAPTGGAVLQAGQAKPSCRCAFATRANTRA